MQRSPAWRVKARCLAAPHPSAADRFPQSNVTWSDLGVSRSDSRSGWPRSVPLLPKASCSPVLALGFRPLPFSAPGARLPIVARRRNGGLRRGLRRAGEAAIRVRNRADNAPALSPLSPPPFPLPLRTHALPPAVVGRSRLGAGRRAPRPITGVGPGRASHASSAFVPSPPSRVRDFFVLPASMFRQMSVRDARGVCPERAPRRAPAADGRGSRGRRARFRGCGPKSSIRVAFVSVLCGPFAGSGWAPCASPRPGRPPSLAACIPPCAPAGSEEGDAGSVRRVWPLGVCVDGGRLRDVLTTAMRLQRAASRADAAAAARSAAVVGTPRRWSHPLAGRGAAEPRRAAPRRAPRAGAAQAASGAPRLRAPRPRDGVSLAAAPRPPSRRSAHRSLRSRLPSLAASRRSRSSTPSPRWRPRMPR